MNYRYYYHIPYFEGKFLWGTTLHFGRRWNKHPQNTCGHELGQIACQACQACRLPCGFFPVMVVMGVS